MSRKTILERITHIKANALILKSIQYNHFINIFIIMLRTLANG